MLVERWQLRGPKRQPGFGNWSRERFCAGWRIYIANDNSYAIALKFVRR